MVLAGPEAFKEVDTKIEELNLIYLSEKMMIPSLQILKKSLFKLNQTNAIFSRSAVRFELPYSPHKTSKKESAE